MAVLLELAMWLTDGSASAYRWQLAQKVPRPRRVFGLAGQLEPCSRGPEHARSSGCGRGHMLPTAFAVPLPCVLRIGILIVCPWSSTPPRPPCRAPPFGRPLGLRCGPLSASNTGRPGGLPRPLAPCLASAAVLIARSLLRMHTAPLLGPHQKSCRRLCSLRARLLRTFVDSARSS